MSNARALFDIANPAHVIRLLAEYESTQLVEAEVSNPDLVNDWRRTLHYTETLVLDAYERSVARYSAAIVYEHWRTKDEEQTATAQCPAQASA